MHMTCLPSEVIKTFEQAIVDPTCQPERVQIFRVLRKRFSVEDLRGLLFSLDTDPEDFSATSKKALAREIVSYFEQRGKLRELVKAMHDERSDIDMSGTMVYMVIDSAKLLEILDVYRDEIRAELIREHNLNL